MRRFIAWGVYVSALLALNYGVPAWIGLLIGACFAGIAGSLYAHYITFINPSSFTIMESILIVLMVVFGGMGSLPGSVIGATILFPEMQRFIGLPSAIAAPQRQIIYGLPLAVLMLYRPQGILGKYRWK